MTMPARDGTAGGCQVSALLVAVCDPAVAGTEVMGDAYGPEGSVTCGYLS